MQLNVLISGGGVAGLTVAYWLERAGIRPVIVEASPDLRTGGYMIDFWGAGYAVAERMGLRDTLQQVGYDIREICLVDEQGDRIAALTTNAVRKALGERYVSLLRGDLVRELHRSIVDRVEILYQDRVKSLIQSDQGVLVGFERHQPQEFDAVIAADGVHSNVRRLTFGTERQFEAPLGYWVAAFIVDGYPHKNHDVYLSRTKPGRQVVRCTLRGGRTVFFVVLVSDLCNARPLDSQIAQKQCIAEAIKDIEWEASDILAVLEQSKDFYFDEICQIAMPSWSRGRVALLGDAAYCPSLLAGEGASLAMAGAYVLAGEIAGSDARIEDRFRAYERRLTRFVQRKQRAARRLGGWFAPRTRGGVWIRNELTRLAGLPVLSNLLLRPMMSDDLSLPDYGRSFAMLT